MPYSLADSFKRRNNVPLDDDYIQSDFFGNALGDPSTRKELCINSPSLFIGFPFWDENTSTAYIIVSVNGSGDTATWTCDSIGSGTGFTNVSLLKKLSEATGNFYYDGKRVALYSELVGKYTYISPVADAMPLGNLLTQGWDDEDEGVYILYATGNYFSGTPFTFETAKNYVVVLEWYKTGFAKHRSIQIFTDSTVSYANKSRWLWDATNGWSRYAFIDEVNALISANQVEKKEVSCIEELLLADETDGYGVPAAQHRLGSIITVKYYDPADPDASEGNGRRATLRYIGANTSNANWGNIDNWEELEVSNISTFTNMHPLVPAATNLEIDLSKPMIMYGIHDESDPLTLVPVNYYGYIGATRRARLTECTGHNIAFDSKFKVIQNINQPIETDEIKLLFEVIRDDAGNERIDVYIDNVPD